jgi:hypothetical protein
VRRDSGELCRGVAMRKFAFDVSIEEIERLGAADVKRIGHQKPLE